MNGKITAIKAQTRNPKRVNVFLDGSYAFSLERLTAAWLGVGQYLDEDKIQSLQNQDLEEVTYQKAIQFINHRMRSETEIVKKLKEHDVDDNLIEQIIDRLRLDRLVNDDQFTKDWVEDRAALHPRSRRLIALELRRKGIADDTIETALSQLSSEEELAFRLAEKKIHRYEHLDWRQFRNRLGSFLGRKGFSYDVIDNALKRTWEKMHDTQDVKAKDEELKYE